MAAKVPLDKLRQEIDEIDRSLQELLVRRTEVSRKVGQAKGSSKATMRPGREAVVLRQLLSLPSGSLSKAVLVRIWREIFAASLAQQGPFQVTVEAQEDNGALMGLARDHFGVETPIIEETSAVRVINAVEQGTASVGLLSHLDTDSQDPWWRHLFRRGDTVPRVLARLPFAKTAKSTADGLMIGLAVPEESGHDRSLLVVELSAQVSRSAMKSKLETAGFVAGETAVWYDDPDRWLHAFEVTGFVTEEDARLSDLAKALGDIYGGAMVIGAYADPLSAEELASD
ncbi:chorismate mutase [Rhodovibrionaceae bacterium A322]